MIGMKGLLVLAAGCLAACSSQSRELRLLRENPLIDGHNDLPWRIQQRARGDIHALDIREPQPSLHTDIARLRAGGLGAQFWSVYVPTSLQGDAAVRATMEQIDIVHQMTAEYPDAFEPALTAADIERIHAKGKIASLIGMEGGHCINGSLGALRMFYRLGARYMTLTHSHNTPWADSCTDEPELGGLSAFGEEVVREMNRLGMLVDISHVSADTMRDVLRVSSVPVIFSHSSARALTDHPRNVPDDVLLQLKANAGVVMVTFVGSFVSEKVRLHSEKRKAERRRLAQLHGNDEERVKALLEQWSKDNPGPQALLSDVADHIDHIRKVAGVDHIGIGSDFDGTSHTPQGLDDVGHFVDLVRERMRRGYSDEQIGKILGRNVLRVMRAVEDASRP